MIQKATFSDGGFILHKIKLACVKGKCSAWYDSNGVLIDAERITSRDISFPVKRNGPIWSELENIGKIYKN